MNLSSIAVKRPITTLMATLMVIVLGIVSIFSLPLNLFPDIDIPVMMVMTTYDGSPEDVNMMVTSPIESAVTTVQGVTGVSSMTSEGSSIVIAEFGFGTDLNFASLDLRERLDMVTPYLPEGASTPSIIKLDPSMQASIMLGVTGEELSLSEIQRLVDDEIEPALQSANGVASIDIGASIVQKVEVEFDGVAMAQYGLSPEVVGQIIATSNINMTAGEMEIDDSTLRIKVENEITTEEDVKNIKFPTMTGEVVSLDDIAEVNLIEEATSLASVNGNPAIDLSIKRQSETNTVDLGKAVTEKVEELNDKLEGAEITIIYNEADYINDTISNTGMMAIGGAIIAVIVIFIFLRSVGSTLIISTAIPISVIFTFFLLYLFGITLNVLTMGGLALGVGMLVDNSIVVLENIYRLRSEGKSKVKAAIDGAKEVSLSITASTFTTIAVFIPVVFIQGMSSEIFTDFALTVTFALLASLIVSLTVIPALASKLDNVKSKALSQGEDADKGAVKGLGKGYKRLMSWALKNRWKVVIVSILVTIISVASIATVGAEFFPQGDMGMLMATVSYEDIDQREEKVAEIDDILNNIDEIDMYFLGASMMGDGDMYMMELVSTSDRDKSDVEVMEEITTLTQDIDGVELQISGMDPTAAMMSGSIVSMTIVGDNVDTLKDISQDFKSIIEDIDGITEVTTSYDETRDEIVIRVDDEKAAQFGLTSMSVVMELQSNLNEQMLSRYKDRGEEIDIVSVASESFESLEELEDMMIPLAFTLPNGMNAIPLSEIAEISIEEAPLTLNKTNQMFSVSVNADAEEGVDIVEINNKVSDAIDEYDMPEGYRVEFGGELEMMIETFTDLALIVVLAVILVYMVLASQFESLLNPFIIMFTVPLALSGGILGLAVTGTPLSTPAFIGFIILSGIIVNNGIVLIDYIDLRRKRGEEKDTAIINAGTIRIRPILMTALTTIVGLIPISLGIAEGTEMMAPMGITVIGGLIMGTFFTLIFIPVVYSLFDAKTKDTRSKLKEIE